MSMLEILIIMLAATLLLVPSIVILMKYQARINLELIGNLLKAAADAMQKAGQKHGQDKN